MVIGQEDFRNALSRFTSGVTVVSTKDTAGKLHGITVSAFCSVSLDPPMVLICIEKSTFSHYAFEESGVFVVNILRDSQAVLSERFAAPFEDKFEDVEYYSSVEGIPILKDALANLECRLKFSYHGGDHSIFVGQVENVTLNDGDPLVYFRGGYGTISTAN